MKIELKAPRINANEDEVKVVGIHVTTGDSVSEGSLLLTFESTKASLEFVAPQEGTIESLSVAVGDMVSVGASVIGFRVEKAEDGTATEALDLMTSDSAVAVISGKARRRAKELNVDLKEVTPTAGYIRVSDVETHAQRARGLPPSPAVSFSSGLAAVVLGGGGHARLVIDALVGSGYRLVACTDPKLPVGTAVANGVRVTNTDDAIERLFNEGVRIAFIGVGGAPEDGPGKILFTRLKALGFTLPALVHKTAYVGVDACLSDGVQVLAGATVGPCAAIGENTIVNQGAIVSHDCRIGKHAHIAPGAILAGDVVVGNQSVIGMGATIYFKTRVGDRCVIHNGANVAGDVASGVIVDKDGSRLTRKAT